MLRTTRSTTISLFSIFLAACGGGGSGSKEQESSAQDSQLLAAISAAVDVPTTFVVQHSRQCLDVRGGPTETDDGAPIEQWSCSGEKNQDWTMVNTTGDRYQIKAISSGKCIEPVGGATANGTGIQQAACRALPRQEWKLRAKGSNGQFEIFHPRSNRCLSIRGGATATDEGAYAELRDCNGQSYQRWRKESPVIASNWSVRELPRVSSADYGDVYMDINDNGDALAWRVTSVTSGARTYGAVHIARADGSIQDFGDMGHEDARSNAINNTLAFVGTTTDNKSPIEVEDRGKPRAYLYSNGAKTDIPLPEVPGVDPAKIWTLATDLNNAAHVVGYSRIPHGDGSLQDRAYRYANGVRTDVTLPAEATATRLFAINDAGKAVGEMDNASGTTRPFIHENGVNNLPPLPNSHNSGSATEINGSGQIAGTLFNRNGFDRTDNRPFIYTDGVLRKIDMPYSEGWGVTSGISERGQVVGTLYSTNAQGQTGAFGVFLHGGGKTIDLNELPQFQTDGIQFREAIAMNSAGGILVRGLEGLTWKYYVLSPVR